MKCLFYSLRNSFSSTLAVLAKPKETSFGLKVNTGKDPLCIAPQRKEKEFPTRIFTFGGPFTEVTQYKRASHVFLTSSLQTVENKDAL